MALTSSALLESAVVLGSQTPRLSSLPPAVSSAGQEVIELARGCGLFLDPWQQAVLVGGCSERADGRWAARDVGLIVARQNGKGAILEARALAALFLFEDELVVHTAHQYRMADEAFRRLWGRIDSTPEYRKRVLRTNTSTMGKSIEMRSGQRILFMARSRSAGRGYSADLMIYDEAQNLSDLTVAASTPTMRARPNPQTWYTGSAPEPESHGEVFRRVRRRGRSGTDNRIAYFEWSAPDDADLDDRQAWAISNPAYGIRISEESFTDDRRNLTDEHFARELLSISPDPDESNVFGTAWEASLDSASTIEGRCVFAIDVTPDRSWASIGVAGLRQDGKMHGEVIDHRPHTDWLPSRLVELRRKHRAKTVVVDRVTGGPLMPELEAGRLALTVVGPAEVARACARLFDLTTQDSFRHIGQPELDTATAGATRRTLGDGFAWDRKHSSGDISPLVAVTLAVWGASKQPARSVRAVNLAELMAERDKPVTNEGT